MIVAYNIPNRDCGGQSAGGAANAAAYQGWIDGMDSSLRAQQAAVILEPDALPQSCGADNAGLLAYAVDSLRANPGAAVYIDAGHSNSLNVSNFQPTDALINYGHALSALVGNKPFVIDTSRNGRGAPGGSFCNPAGAGLGLPPTANTGDALVHAFSWIKRPGESDGSCGECASTPAGQFCRSYALHRTPRSKQRSQLSSPPSEPRELGSLRISGRAVFHARCTIHDRDRSSRAAS